MTQRFVPLPFLSLQTVKDLFQQARRVVVKLGTGILTRGVGELDTERIAAIAAEVAMMKAQGRQVLVVSSGAVGLGMGRLGLKSKPPKLSSLQKCAAVGQSILTETWQKAFDPHGIVVAQLLLTREDVRSRGRHLALRSLIDEMLAEGIVPIINENDSISAAEIKFGDNDMLSALISSLCEAKLLVILSTAPGVIDRGGSEEIIPLIKEVTKDIEALAGGTESSTGTGGMITKLAAAKLASRSGCTVFIGSGREPQIIERLLGGQGIGTLFLPARLTLKARQRWIAYFQEARGQLHIDAGALIALRDKGGSLLAKGVRSAKGSFAKGDVVEIIDADGQRIARGIAGFGASEVTAMLGQSNEQIRAARPGLKHCEVVHRDKLVLLDSLG